MPKLPFPRCQTLKRGSKGHLYITFKPYISRFTFKPYVLDWGGLLSNSRAGYFQTLEHTFGRALSENSELSEYLECSEYFE